MTGPGPDAPIAEGLPRPNQLWSSIACILRRGQPLAGLDRSSLLMAAARANPEAFARLHPGPFLFGELDRSVGDGSRDESLDAFHNEALSGKAIALNLDAYARRSEQAFSRRLRALHFLIELRSEKGRAGEAVTLGRHRDRDIVIDDHRISALHAYFGQDKDRWFLADADSANGTFLNGEPLRGESPCLLVPRVTMRFGQRVFARFLELSDLLGVAEVYRRRRPKGA